MRQRSDSGSGPKGKEHKLHGQLEVLGLRVKSLRFFGLEVGVLLIYAKHMGISKIEGPISTQYYNPLRMGHSLNS